MIVPTTTTGPRDQIHLINRRRSQAVLSLSRLRRDAETIIRLRTTAGEGAATSSLAKFPGDLPLGVTGKHHATVLQVRVALKAGSRILSFGLGLLSWMGSFLEVSAEAVRRPGSRAGQTRPLVGT